MRYSVVLPAGLPGRPHRYAVIPALRPAEARDFEIVRLLAQGASELPEAAAGSAPRVRFLDGARARFLRSLADPAEFWRVAEVNGAVVGWIHAGIREDGATRAPSFMEIVMLYVAQVHRRHGIARALMALVERLARGARVATLRLVVHGSNTGAVGLYTGLGFVAGQGLMEKHLAPLPGTPPE